MKKTIVFVLLLLVSQISVFAQGNKQLDARITEVYGSATDNFTDAQIAWINSQIQRSEVRKVPFSAGEQYAKLSSLKVINKFVPTLTMETTFDPTHINPLKYAIDFNNTQQDQLFRIDNTDYVLVILKKK